MPRARPLGYLEGRSGQGRSREPSGKEGWVKLYVLTSHDRYATAHRATMEGLAPVPITRATHASLTRIDTHDGG